MPKLWQYQVTAEPVSQESENITLDKWFSQSPEPIRPSKFKTAVFAAALFFVGVVLPAAPTVDAWYQRLSEPVRLTKSYAYITETQLVVVVAPTPPDFGWYQQTSEPVRVVENRVYITIGDLQLDDAQRPETVVLSKWYQELNRPVLPRFKAYYYPSIDFRTEFGVILAAAVTTKLFKAEGRQILFEVKDR